MTANPVIAFLTPDAPSLRSGEPLLVGLVGTGIQQSRSPAMHEAEGARHGLRCVYRLFDTDRMGTTPPSLEEVLRAAELCGFAGLNVTHPYKIEVMAHLDELSDAARALGAVNTIVFHDGRRTGHNTDLWGFAESFRRSMADVNRRCVLLVGAGGAGIAVGHALMQCATDLVLIADLDRARAEALARNLEDTYGAHRARALGDICDAESAHLDGIVNATPVGMAKCPGMPVPARLIDDTLWIADIVYFPLETELLATAREKGCRVLSGSGMAVFQAARAFELFTGLAPDADRMTATFESFGE